jgi:MarR family
MSIIRVMNKPDRAGGTWTLLTGHGHVLVEIARNPGARIRDIAAVAGITQRTTAAIIADLEDAGYLTRTRTGRRTSYTVNPDNLFRHPAQGGHRVGPFLALLAGTGDTPHPHQPDSGAATPDIPSPHPARPSASEARARGSGSPRRRLQAMPDAG